MVFLIIGFVVVCVTGYLLLTSYKKGSGDPNEHINTIQADKLSPDMNRWAAGKEGKAATARAAAAEALNREAAAVTDMHRKQAEATQAEFDRKEASSRAEEARSREMKEHDIYIQLAHEALELGVSVESLIKLKEHELMKQIEVRSEAEIARLKIQYALIAEHLLEHQNIASLQEQIDRFIIEVAEIESGSLRGQPVPLVARARLIAEREQTIKTFKKDKAGRERLLIRAYKPGKDAGGKDPDSDLR